MAEILLINHRILFIKLDQVEQSKSYICVLLEEKTKKGGWKAKVKTNEEISGPIVNSQAVPADKVAGSEIKLKVTVLKGNNTSFQFI